MKDCQNMIGKLAIAAAIIIAGVLIAEAIEVAGASIGSQISSALAAYLP